MSWQLNGLIPSLFWPIAEAESMCSDTPSPCSDCRSKLPPRQEQIGRGCQPIDLAAILGHAPQLGLLKAELLLWPPADFV